MLKSNYSQKGGGVKKTNAETSEVEIPESESSHNDESVLVGLVESVCPDGSLLLFAAKLFDGLLCVRVP